MNFDHITKEQFLEIEALVLELEPKINQNLPADKIRLLFNLHNKVYWRNQEHSTGCGGCRSRVWNKMKTWYYEQRDNFTDKEVL